MSCLELAACPSRVDIKKEQMVLKTRKRNITISDSSSLETRLHQAEYCEQTLIGQPDFYRHTPRTTNLYHASVHLLPLPHTTPFLLFDTLELLGEHSTAVLRHSQDLRHTRRTTAPDRG